MRVAICISGLVRTYRETYENFIATLIEPNKEHEIDIFISTWDVEHSNKSMVRTRQLCFGGLDQPPIVENLIDFNDLQEKYKPVLMEVDRQIDCRPPKFMDFEPDLKSLVAKINTQSYWFMMYKVYACNELRRKREKLQGWEYDVVIRTRSDVTFDNPFVINSLDPEILKEKLTAPAMQMGPIYPEYNWLFDSFAVSNGTLMTKYTGLIDGVQDLIEGGMPIQPESLLYAHLVKQEVPLNIIDFNIQFIR